MNAWKRFAEEKPEYGMNVLIQTKDGWMHEAFRNIGNRGDFYRSGRFTMDASQLFSWRFLPEDILGGTPVNAPNHEATTRAENERLRKALEEIATECKWADHRSSAGKSEAIARHALEKGE